MVDRLLLFQYQAWERGCDCLHIPLPLAATLGRSSASPGEIGAMWRNRVHLGDCLTVLSAMPADYVDLIVTSPPYADARKHTYGGIAPDRYVEWFAVRAD